MRVERTTSLGTLLLSGSLVLAACGDDGPTGEGSAGTSTGGSAGSAETTPPGTTAVESADSTAGPGQTTETPTTDMPTTGEESTGEPPGQVQAFRFTEMNVRDPHFFPDTLLGCVDVTDDAPLGMPGINDQFNDAINGDDPAMPDGNLDLNLMLLFRPLDQADGGDVEFANGTCTVPPIECDIQAGTNPFATSYMVMQAGTCFEPDPTHLSTENYQPEPGTTTGPCFVGGPTDVEIVTASFTLPLGQALIAAQFADDPANDLVQGTLRGFLSTADAESIILPDDIQMQTGAMTIAELLPGGNNNCAGHDDTDGEGWWMYVDYTASRVPWVGQ
jgi:hypothetical protein